tara:strand:- start:13 stop:402 length:390 start_codon:yes stop_codon:yes gene_type:complete
MAPAVAFSQSLNLNLPQSPSSYQSDRFRHGDLDCSNAIGGSTNLEFGVVGLLDQQQQPFDTIGNNSSNVFGDYQKDVGVYARITIPLDKPKERINCNTLYKLALERERLEVQRLKAEVQQLKRLQFEND